MPDVTVLGAGGATVTIALTSAQNAAAAQTAINVANKLTQSGIVDQITWSGSGTLPAPQNLLAGAIISTPGDVGALTAQYIGVAVNAAGKSTVIGPQNFNSTVVAGDTSSLTYGNQSQAGKVFFGNGSNVLLNFQGNADMAGTDGTYIIETDSDATTTANIGGKATVLTSDLLGKAGATTINVAAGSNATISASGSSTIPASINAVDGKLFVASYDKGTAVIHPGQANITVVGGLSTTSTVTGADNGGRVTLFGGTGSAVVSNGQGNFTGGLAGNNELFSSTVAGSATLTGGGSGDQLFAMGQGQLLIAGAGSETLVGRFGGEASTYIVGNGFATVFGGGAGGNTYLFDGLGSALIDGRDETKGPATQNTYQEFNVNPGGTFLIGDFLTGTDKFLIPTAAGSVTITFFTAGENGSPFGAAAGTQMKLGNNTTYNFFDTGNDGQADITNADVIRF